MKRTRLLLADDHDIVIAGLRQVLDQPDFEIVGAVNDGRALLQHVDQLRPDTVVTDITMPLLNGIDAARQIRKSNPNIKFVFLTMHSEVAYATEALSMGKVGFVLKGSAAMELPPAIRQVMEGRSYIARSIAEIVTHALEGPSHEGGSESLTLRQREILQLLSEGLHVKEIGAKLHLSPRTVEFHKYKIMEGLGVHTVAELVRSAIALKILK